MARSLKELRELERHAEIRFDALLKTAFRDPAMARQHIEARRDEHGLADTVLKLRTGYTYSEYGGLRDNGPARDAATELADHLAHMHLLKTESALREQAERAKEQRGRASLEKSIELEGAEPPYVAEHYEKTKEANAYRVRTLVGRSFENSEAALKGPRRVSHQSTVEGHRSHARLQPRGFWPIEARLGK